MKPFYKSRTIMFNVIPLIILIAGAMGWQPEEALVESIAMALIGLTPLINIYLRSVTDTGITLKLKK